MMRKKTNYTHITPIPPHIPRRLAIDLLHSHGEIITLNPLVLDYKPKKAPRDAPADEYYSTWYQIEQRIQYIPGAGKLGSGKISFQGCFHDMDYGIQTHMYAPANVDLRNKWRICGNQPGEPREVTEIGIGAPAEGLYLREDVEIKCNIAMASFVKKEMKAASTKMVERLIKKAELLDSGALQAMMEDGRLKTLNPADRSSTMGTQPPASPGFQSAHPSYMAQGLPSKHGSQYYQMPLSPTLQPPPMAQHPAYAQQQQQQRQLYPQQQFSQASQHPPQTIAMELPGDYYHPSGDVPAHLQPQDKRHSYMSELSGSSPTMPDQRWSNAASDYQASNISSRPTSYATDTSGMQSPRPEQTSFGSNLAPMRETREEHERRESALNRLEGNNKHKDDRNDGWQPYNPADYA